MTVYSRINLIAIIVCLFAADLSSQVLETMVSFDYQEWRFEDAILDLGKTYDIKFVYSPDKIPVNEIISAKAEATSLQKGLDELLKSLPVKYQTIGQRVVLKKDKLKKIRSYTKLELPNPNEDYTSIPTPMDDTGTGDDKGKMPVLDSVRITPSLELLLKEKRQNRQIKRSGGNSFHVPEIDLSFLDRNSNSNNNAPVVAQVSVAPGVSTNARKAKERVNRASFNLTWGVNGGVNGAEIGVVGNTVHGNVQGVQIGGLMNVVKGNVVGTQFSGLLNIAKKRAIGFQGSLFGNYMRNGNGVQLGGIWNVVKEDFVGLQIATLFNATSGKNFGWQISPGFNFAGEGRTQAQISSLFNMAYDVQIAQIGCINSANIVGGVQVGFVNVADSVGIVSIGLLNFIKKGYNRIELSSGDLLKWNAAYKFGTYGFYNIVHIGLHSENKIIQKGKDDWSEENISWALGYGIGTSLKLGRRWRTNFEIVGMHVNEKIAWEKKLNMLAQTRLGLEFRLGKKLSLFCNGSLNLLASKRIERDTGIFGSQLPDEDKIVLRGSFTDDKDEYGEIKGWFGFNAGVRF